MQNENSEILIELKKITKSSESQKKYGIVFIVLILVAISLQVFTKIKLTNEETKYYENKNKLLETRQEEKLPLWRDIQNKIYADDINGAIKILEESVNQNPENYYNQAELADYYLRINKPKKALEHYEKVYSLIPLEKYERIINAIKKRLKQNS